MAKRQAKRSSKAKSSSTAKTSADPGKPARGRPAGSAAGSRGAAGTVRTAPAGKAQRAGSSTGFKLTYATMFDPPEEFHDRFETALAAVKSGLGREHGMMIGGKEVLAAERFEDRSPINRGWLLGVFQKGARAHARQAVEAARAAFPAWSRTPWKSRVRLIRKAADIIEKRVYEFGAVIAMEVGKNRTEALGDAAETADLMRYACEQVESNKGFIVPMGKDPVRGFTVRNVSVLRPYGVWVVISPFNFPCALTGGPVGTALVAGNTVVFKPATNTPWTSRLIAEALRDAGVPDGVFNYVTGPGGTLGQALIEDPGVDGITFTGSYDVGMQIYRGFAAGRYARPTIVELGGKNPCIVSRNADLDRAAVGVVRSAFGLQGQKCSANSRLYVERQVYDDLLTRLARMTEDLSIGDPTMRGVFMGPVNNQAAYTEYKECCAELSRAGRVLTGGHVRTDGDLADGYFCEPTVAADLPLDHRLWEHEMFLPILTVAPIKDLEEGLRLANSTRYGLTAGFYGSKEEATRFFDGIEAGVCYANRPQGSTTGAWPGFQPFGGWKGSGSTGKSAGGRYYVPLYTHEQVQTTVV